MIGSSSFLDFGYARAVRPMLVCCALLAAIVFALPASAAASPAAAKRFIQDLGDRTLAVLEADGSRAARRAELEAIFREGLDLDGISRFVMGRHWSRVTPAQRREYRKLFDAFVIGISSRRMLDHSVAGLRVLTARSLGSRDYAVDTVVSRPGAPDVALTFRVRGRKQRLGIVDLIVNGLSLSVTQRSEIASVIRREGVDGLLSRLREQVTRLKSEKD